MNELIVKAKFSRSNVELNREEKIKMFYWCRDQAHDALSLARMIRGASGVHPEIMRRYFEEAMMFLHVARSVFPTMGDGDSVSIESILNGKVPQERGK